MGLPYGFIDVGCGFSLSLKFYGPHYRVNSLLSCAFEICAPIRFFSYSSALQLKLQALAFATSNLRNWEGLPSSDAGTIIYYLRHLLFAAYSSAGTQCLALD